MAYYRSRRRRPAEAAHPASATRTDGCYYEELMGEEGFSSDSSLLYHRGVPSAIVDSQVWELPDQTTTPNHPLKPRHLKLHDLSTGSTSEVRPGRPAAGWCSATTTSGSRTSSRGAAVAVLPQRDRRRVRLRRVRRRAPSRRSSGCCRYRTGDYVIVPRATTHRWVPAEPSRGSTAIEANSHIAPPKRYLSRYGQLLEHAPYCERDLHGPGEPFLGRGRRTSRCWSSTAAAVRAASSAPG